jgi:UDP-glucose 4-epimerase
MYVVTGGAGFIGSHTVDALLARGQRVVVLDNFSTGKRENLTPHDRLTVIECDVANSITDALSPLVAQHGPVERIVHLAAQVSVVASVANPAADMRVNYGGTLHVLEYARAYGVKKVVFASSAAIYGDVTEMPVDEDMAKRPVSPYGIHKLASEQAIDYYANVHGVSGTALRFFNVYGPRQDPSSPYSGVISIFSDRARAGRTLTIFGDGQQTRDFIYVADVVRAILAALDNPASLAANVGTGGEITVLELARTIVDLAGGTSQIQHAPPRAGEILKSRARVDQLRDRLGVVAETKLVDGLRKTISS